jgi:hypothetical protein
METLRYFETTGTNRSKTQRYIPEYVNLDQHRCEKLKSRTDQLYGILIP